MMHTQARSPHGLFLSVSNLFMQHQEFYPKRIQTLKETSKHPEIAYNISNTIPTATALQY